MNKADVQSIVAVALHEAAMEQQRMGIFQTESPSVVVMVPEGVLVVGIDGRHILVRIDDAHVVVPGSPT